MLQASNNLIKQHPAKMLQTTRSLNKGADLDWYLAGAEREFADEEDIDEALRKFIRANQTEGLFFLDEDDDRCRYGPIIYLQHGSWPGFRGPRHYDVDEGDRKFVFDIKKPTLRDIDRPKPRSEVIAAAHPSERGWKLPKDHPRHILSLPVEILSLIYDFALKPSDGSPLEPMTITSNWKTEFRASSCHRQGQGRYDTDCRSSVKWFDARDEAGDYKLIRPIRRAIIDASFLRTSKAIYNLGIGRLFGSNDWHFSMINLHRRASPPSLIRNGGEYAYIHPTVEYPKTTDEDYMATVATALKNIRDRSPLHELPGFVYYDRFLRFLHTIGPKNASQIKVLRFGGVCMRHMYCPQETCRKGCDVDLMGCLRAYIPFVKRFCTGLEKLVLHTKEDKRFEHDPSYYGDSMPKSREEAILSFLENEVRQLSTLKELEVYDGLGGGCLDYAKPTMDWFKDRAAKKAREDRETHIRIRMQIMEARAREENLHCGFCGEGHVWANCYNLCKLCGEFGHFAKACPHTK